MLEINRDDPFPVILRELEFDQIVIACVDPAAAIQPIQEEKCILSIDADQRTSV